MTLLILFICGAWTESFETQKFFPPNDWMIVNEDALDAVWYRALGQSHSGQYAATCYYDTAYSGLSYTNRDYLITPQVLPRGGDTTVSFWYITSNMSPCSLVIMISTASPPAMSSFVVVRTMVLAATSWTQETVSLGAYNNTPVYVAFQACRIPLQQTIRLDYITLPIKTVQPHICNGRLRTKGPPSQRYMQVWGSNYEMGFAHGYLFASEVMSIFLNKWIGYTSYHSTTPASYENEYLPWYRDKYFLPTDYQEEARGIIDGITAKGVSLFHPDLGRNLNAEDIGAVYCGGDATAFGCSSLSGWGESTSSDDTLQGGFIIARNVDASVGLYTCIPNVSSIIAYSPSDLNKQRFFNISFAGTIGVYSCINAHGLGLCSNAGNHPDTNSTPPNSIIGAFLSNRQAIESIDPDGNGVNDIYDIDSVKVHSRTLRSNDIHVYSLYDGGHPVPGAVLEINNIGDSLRFVNDNYISPPINSQWNLAVTNHDRVLYPPVYCQRYQRIADSLNADFHLSTQRAMRIANTVAWTYIPSTSGCTYHSMVLRPNIAVAQPDWPCVGVSYARRYIAAHTVAKVWYSWNELFEGVPGVGVKEVVVNPLQKSNLPSTIIAGPLQLPDGKNWMVFDIAGREININHMPVGIYFVTIDGETIRKVVKIK